ncbi:MAG: VCBS repeat-containing protein [Verrucomicrobia bacterium]|nr:VCBS repeat-containing protein [Verrucomicrobiota bacterium]
MKTTILIPCCLAMFAAEPLAGQPAYFTQVTEGPIVTDAEASAGCALVDYDNDGLVDVFVATIWGGTNVLYHNDGNFTFGKVTTEPMVTTYGDYRAGVFADYDNDGDLDLFVSCGEPYTSRFFRNDLGAGNSTLFTGVTTGAWVNTVAVNAGAAWGDYDNDGFVDLAVVNSGMPPQSEFLYRNDGSGGMLRVTAPPLTSSGGRSQGCAWGDHDNDGDLDLVVANAFYETNQPTFLFRNDRAGVFTRETTGPLVTTPGYHLGLAWADYDNDGDLDLYVAKVTALSSSSEGLFVNNGDGTFTPDLAVRSDATSQGPAWGDFDNDGYLDLFVCNQGEADMLLHNEHDGTFTRILDSDPVTAVAHGFSSAWADLDNDGFLDLFVANNWAENAAQRAEPNFLYRNDAASNGNTNGWLLVRLIGTASNRSGIGAKIRAKATLSGKEVWQLREISGGSGKSNQNDLRAHFGLGDAAQVDLLRIEWPSGIVQEIANLPANQALTVTEHQDGATNAPSLAMSNLTDGTVQLTATGQADLRYVFEASTDLAQWTKLAVRTNLTGTVEYASPTSSSPQRFYRVVVP